MIFLAVLVSLVALGFAVLAFVDQRALYRRLASRRHRDPAANEPSGAAYAFGRATWLVLAGLFAFGAFQVSDAADVTSLSGDEAREIVDRAATGLEAEPHLRPPTDDTFEEAVQGAVRDAARASDSAFLPSTTLAGSGAQGGAERYEVSMDEGAYRFCLVVTPSESGEGGVSVPGVGGEPGTTEPAYDLATKVRTGACGGD